MANSLATRENLLRGPRGPPDCAARGVCAGDGEIRRLGNERRPFGRLARRDPDATNRPRRTNCGRKGLGSPSGHRHPENKAWHGSSPFKRRRVAPMSRSRTRRRHLSGGSIRCFLLATFPRGPSPGDQSAKPSDGSTTRLDIIRAGRRPSHDGPGKCLAQPTSESTGADSVRIRNASKIGAPGRLGKFFSRMHFSTVLTAALPHRVTRPGTGPRLTRCKEFRLPFSLARSARLGRVGRDRDETPTDCVRGALPL
jgi:hypothetical protein